MPWAQRCPGRPEAGSIFLYLCHYYLPWPLASDQLYAKAGRADAIIAIEAAGVRPQLERIMESGGG